jgi:excisionase family DNA binding protein
MDFVINAILPICYKTMDEDRMDGYLDEFSDYHASLCSDAGDSTQLSIVLSAEDFWQAEAIAEALFRDHALVGLEILSSRVWQAREGLDPEVELLSVRQAADRLKISRQTVLQRIHSGSLDARKVGVAWAIPKVAVESLVDEAAASQRGRAVHFGFMPGPLVSDLTEPLSQDELKDWGVA